MSVVLKWLEQSGGIGNFIVIEGPPHTGKTTILCGLFERVLSNNFEVITTTKVFKPPAGLTIVNSASELLKAYSKTEGRVIIAIDDAQATFDSTSMASTRKAKMNETIYLFMAKLQANFLFVAHYLNKIPKPIRECEPLLITAVKPGYMKMGGKMTRVKNTPYAFPKAFIPSWKWDINPYELYDRLSKVEGDTDQEIIDGNKKAILAFLGDNPSGHDARLNKRETVELLLDLLEPYMGKRVSVNQRFIANLVGSNNPAYVSKINIDKKSSV